MMQRTGLTLLLLAACLLCLVIVIEQGAGSALRVQGASVERPVPLALVGATQ